MPDQQIPHGPKDLICPFHRAKMEKVCHTCPLWTQVRGVDPNTGHEVDRWNCSFTWLPMLLIENAKETRQGAAATESFRNEMVSRADKTAAEQRIAYRPGNGFQPPMLIDAS